MATSKQIPIDNSYSSFMNFIYAVESNDINTAINILNKELSNADRNNKQQLIVCTKYAIKFLFRYEKYKFVVEQCNKLRLLHYNIDDDEQTHFMEIEAGWKVATQKAHDQFERLSTKFQSDAAESACRHLQDKKNPVSTCTSKRKRNN